MNAHKIAEELCKKAEALGLCHPTEGMIAEMVDNLLSNHLQEIDYELRDAGFHAAAKYLFRLRTTQHHESQP